ncbi:helix-turn-helix domain-containing protein [Oceanivirga salmonicida]|uniref:helix-turn-helix domain-containing protein n=1 Tax=Oceanivirga salmonicida TaxID=1769291 RepID=UPI0008347FC3|nr:helix-turn-helix domain-containing protein [Oceanivirga salmonicida]
MDLKTRFEIEFALKENKSIREIANILKINPSTVSREIKKYKQLIKNKRAVNLNKKEADKVLIKKHPCNILKTGVKVCNGCTRYLKNNCL